MGPRGQLLFLFIVSFLGHNHKKACANASHLSTRILAADMWYTHFQSAPLNQDAGLKYRKMILNYGGSQDEWKLLTSFLGRDPNIQAYFKDIGATTPENKGEENTFDKFGNHVP